MCKQKKLNRYQRDVRKFLEMFLGYRYPYYLETTGKNHLKIMIRHIEPIITSGTPSDGNAIKNFRAEVKRKVREYENSLSEKKDEMPIITPRANSNINFDDIILTGIRTLKARIDGMKKNEKTKVLEENSTDVIKVYRNEVITETVAGCLSKYKVNSYVAPGEMKKIKKALLEHLTFIMPSTAEYASFLKQPNAPLLVLSEEDNICDEQNQEAEIEQVIENAQVTEDEWVEEDKVSFLHKNETNQTQTALNHIASKKSKNKTAKMLNSMMVKKDIALSLEEVQLSEPKSQPQALPKKEIILNKNNKNRINQLRQLSFAEANALIEDIQKAIELNREEQTLHILQLMAQNGISIDDLKTKSASVA